MHIMQKNLDYTSEKTPSFSKEYTLQSNIKHISPKNTLCRLTLKRNFQWIQQNSLPKYDYIQNQIIIANDI